MGSFLIHRSNRVERLVSTLATRLERPLGSAFEQEAVVVPGRGMAVWLSMELSRRLGVWATPLAYPRAFVEDVARRVLGQHALGAEPLSAELLEWGVRAVLPTLLGEPDFRGLARYLADDPHGVRLAEVSERLASVFDQYLTYRPEWVRAWEGGGTVSVGPEDRFQPQLFRRVAQRLGCRHVGELEPALLARLGEPRRLALPPRVSVLGVSTLPPLFVRVLVALARHVPVELYLFAPSPELERGTPADARRPLLAALGQVGLELDEVLRATLEEQGGAAEYHDDFERPRATTLLGALGLHLFEPAAPAPSAVPLDGDESIAVHACHGPAREVEVLHDQLLALLTRAADPVAPEDVLVLVSDIEAYAPLIEATFRRDADDRRAVPFHVADRGGRQSSPLYEVFLRVLGLTRGRVTGADVLDLLLVDAVRRRLGLDAAGADMLKTWVVESGVRWGMDAEHREAHGVPGAGGANTWRFGLNRLLLGYALPADAAGAFHGLVGYDEVEGHDAELIGTLADFARTLFGWLHELGTPRSISDWSVALSSLLGVLFSDDAETAAETALLRRALGELVRTATVAGFEEPLDIAVVQKLLERRMDSLSPERGFLAGGVTFSAMVPMRSIPFRVIALLGMNDGAFPRSPRPSELDLTKNGRNPRAPGDRAPREDDRYLFLETLCAARERLLVTYAGRSVRDDRELAPSVCLAELLDALAGPAGSERSSARRDALTVHHHLQGFSPAYFDGKHPKLWSYAEEHVGGARGLLELGAETRSFLGRLEPPAPPAEIALEDLVRFVKSPPAYLLNRRLGIYLSQDRTEVKAREPLELNALERWKLGAPLIEHCLKGIPSDESERLLRGTGELPLGAWGRHVLDECRGAAQRIAEETRARRGGEELEPLDLNVALPGGSRLAGTLGGLFPEGRVEHTFSQAKPKSLLALWIRHLALAASGRGVPSVLVTQKDGNPVVQVLAPLAAEGARERLGAVAALFVEGQARALPFLPVVSRAYWYGIRTGDRKKGPKSPPAALASAAGEYEHQEIEREPHAPLAFDGRRPPFDAAFDAGDRRLEETEFHRLALSLFDTIAGDLAEGAA